ncbi:MAG: hypothetical protein ACREL7_17590 [Longimicrobiales bacterium]
MRVRAFTRLAPLIGIASIVAACASGGTTATPAGGAQTQQGETPPAADGTVVTILNTAPGATTITVYMKPEIGVDAPLGTVEGGQMRTFPYEGAPGFYQIRTVGAAGERLSDRFQMFRNSSVRWDMSAGRRVVVGGR